MDLIITGVGGQGVLTLGTIVGNCFLEMGYDVRVAEVHGLSQRGGSVLVHVRAGEKIFAPTISAGYADLLIALEGIEGARYVNYLKKNGDAIINNEIIPPPLPGISIPSLKNIKDVIKKYKVTYYFVDASSIARKLGNIRVTNVVMLGVALGLKLLPFEREQVVRVLRTYIPKKYLDINIRALDAGIVAGRDIVSR
ncbi:MAG: indolepyruvate oxidoreductase subunit beta [Thermoprotei archaeon]|nr:MAG: indolepyruvate oxidoreductase subunit beta [Thermoprotei archaeon]